MMKIAIFRLLNSQILQNYHYLQRQLIVLEQNMFNITLKSFDDNKVLKNCQLDMLIFVQVYKTIDKNFEKINRFWKNKREQRNNQKGSF